MSQRMPGSSEQIRRSAGRSAHRLRRRRCRCGLRKSWSPRSARSKWSIPRVRVWTGGTCGSTLTIKLSCESLYCRCLQGSTACSGAWSRSTRITEAVHSRSELIHDPAGHHPSEVGGAVLALSAVRALHFAVAIQIVGALLFVWIMARLPETAAVRSVRRSLVRAAVVLAVAVLASGAAWIALQAADMTGHTQVWGDGAVGLLLFKTHAGVVWWARFAIALALLVSLCVMASLPHIAGKAMVVVGLGLAIANFVSCAWLSHAASDAGPYASLHLAAHALPMFAVSLGPGGLLPLAMLVVRAMRSPEIGAATAACASVSFGNIALVAVGIIVVTGIATTALVARDLSDLTTGAYARLLAVKLVLFCFMLALAAMNRLQLVPGLATSNPGPAATRLWWSILGELVLAMMILLVVGLLGIAPLGADE